MESKKRSRASDRPTFDEFHQIVTKMASGQKFTKAAIEAFRLVYFSYLDHVAVELEQHDKVSENDGVVLRACQVNSSPQFSAWADLAQSLLQEKGHKISSTKSSSRTKRAKQVTAEMEAEQERLLKKSLDAMKTSKIAHATTK